MQGRALSGSRVQRAASNAACHKFRSSSGCSSSGSGRVASRSSKRAGVTRARLMVRAGPVEIDEDDLLQIPDRLKWYETKFSADDMPDWNIGRFVSSRQIAPGVKSVVLEVEAGREKVPLRNAYKSAGQRAMVRVNSGLEFELPVASAPFPYSINHDSLVRVRGDLFAGEVKTGKPEPVSVLAEVELLVSKEAAPDVYDMDLDDYVEVGPFRGSGLDMKSSGIMAIFRYPTVVMFVSGKGIATARALVQSTADAPSLCAKFRQDVRMYYKVPNDASLCYKEEFNEWEVEMGVKVVPTTSSSFFEAFDDDDTLVYNPETTGALILTGAEEEEEKDARKACKEAEIEEILSDITEPDTLVIHLDSTPNTFSRWVKDK